MNEVMFFGCKGECGHYLWDQYLSRLDYKSCPWGYNIDGRLQPHLDSEQGVCTVNYKDGWTALSFWDYSVDTRPGSNSSFLAKGHFNFNQMKGIAGNYFPAITVRFDFELKEFKKGE